MRHRSRSLLLSLILLLVSAQIYSPVRAQDFTIEDILSPAWPFDLVAAADTDRIAWLAYERGRRNVWTAVAPDFEPVRLTDWLSDNGLDLSGLQISADGSLLIFVRGHDPNRQGWVANPTSDPAGGEQAVWAMHTSGGEPWKVVETGAPVLSPDGRWVYFVREGQIHRVPTDPHELTARTPVPGAGETEPLFLAWGTNRGPVPSPDGRLLAFTSSRDDHAYIGIYDLESRTVIYMAPGVDRDSSPTWSHDSARIAFIRRPGDSFGRIVGAGGGAGYPGRSPAQVPGRPDQEREERPDGLRQAAFSGGYTLSFWVGDPRTGQAREFWHTAPGDTVFTRVSGITWAAGNVVFRAEKDNWRHLFSVAVDGDPAADPEDLTPGEGIAEQWAFSPDGEWLFYSSNAGDIDHRHIWRTRTDGGRNRQLTEGERIETYPVGLASGETVACLHATERRPLSVAIVRARGGEPEAVFPVLSESFPFDEQVVPENVVLTADDGLEFHNQVFLPRDLEPGEKRPAMLFTHGGPQRQMLLGYHYMHFYHMAYAINQYLAARGYIVISVNYRSGIGYGEEFRNAPDRGRRGNSEYRDVEAAGRWLQSHDNVDPERIGLWGLSYGGILTAQGLARNSDIFSAGVDIAGVHLWGSSLDPESVSYQASSISEIGNWTSPVLLIHGDDDRNVAFSQTVGLVQLLRAHDIYHELIVFPDDVHDSLLFDRWLITFNALDDFFDRFLIEK